MPFANRDLTQFSALVGNCQYPGLVFAYDQGLSYYGRMINFTGASFSSVDSWQLTGGLWRSRKHDPGALCASEYGGRFIGKGEYGLLLVDNVQVMDG
jgi:hypothetical protein